MFAEELSIQVRPELLQNVGGHIHPRRSDRPAARRHHRLELWRLHDHVRRHVDHPFPRRRGRRRHFQLESYYGENSIDTWMIPYFGASVYDDPAVYAKMSAVDYIKQVKTPTLVVVGDRDCECPAPQSYEFWHALKASE